MAPPKKSSKNFRFLVIAGLLLLAGALALPLDTIITANRRSDYVAGDFRRIVQLSEIFGHGFGFAVVIYMLWILAPVKRRMVPRLAACAFLPGLVVQIIKLFVARRRPGFYYPEFTDQVADTWVGLMPNATLNHEYVTQSFPSAHAATAIGLAIGLSWLFPQGRLAFFVLGGLAAFQRVVAGAHWSSDVLAGAAVGVFVCGVIFRIRQLDSLFARLENPNAIVPQRDNANSSDKQMSKAA